MLQSWWLLFASWLGFSGALLAQDIEPGALVQQEGDVLVLEFSNESGQNIRLYDWVELAQALTGKSFLLPPELRPGKQGLNQELNLVGTKRIPHSQFYSFFQSILKIHGFACVQHGTGALEVIEIVPLNAQTASQIRSTATFVDHAQIEAFANQPATWIQTIVPLAHAVARSDTQNLGNNLRVALSAGGVNNDAIMPLPSENAIFIQGFGPFVANAVRMVHEMDREVGNPSSSEQRTPGEWIRDEGDTLIFDAGPGGTSMTIGNFISLCQLHTGLTFTLDDTLGDIGTRLEENLVLYGTKRVAKADLFQFFQMMMKINGFACVPKGDGALTVVVLVREHDATWHKIKGNLRLVEPEKVKTHYADQAGTYIGTVLRLKHAQAQGMGTNLRTALGAGIGTQDAFMPLPTENAILIQGFGPFVASALATIERLDVPSENKPEASARTRSSRQR